MSSYAFGDSFAVAEGKKSLGFVQKLDNKGGKKKNKRGREREKSTPRLFFL
jgi:hypothetical protein